MIRDLSYRVEVIRNGALYSTLKWEKGSPPNVITSSSAEIKSSLKGQFYVDTDVSLLTDELRPVIVIDGQSYPLGMYKCSTSYKLGTKYGGMLDIEAYDRTWLAKAKRTETLLHLSAGSNYVTTIEQLLAQAGIVMVISTPSTAKLSCDREDWKTGTDYLTIVNTLLQEIGYSELWCDAEGYAHIEPYSPPSADRIVRHYSSRDIRRTTIFPDYSEETDLFDAPNVFICICSNPELPSPLVATAVNDSPLSSKSVYKRGMRICETVNVPQVADQEALQVQADRLRDESMSSTRKVSYSILAEPGHGVGDIVSIDHPDIGGIYKEIEWSLSLEPGGMMELKAARTVIE